VNVFGGGGNIVRNIRPIKEGVKGSPLFNTEMTIGKVIFKDKNIVEGPVNIDISTNELIIQSTKGYMYFYFSQIDSLLLLEDNRLFVFFNDDHKYKGFTFGEFIHAYNGVEYFVNYKSEMVKANFEGPYSAGNSYDEYFQTFSLYKIVSGAPEKIKFNLKSLKNEFGEDFNKINDYIIESNFNFSKSKDKLEILNFLRNIYAERK
jgi:hypothetical protein